MAVPLVVSRTKGDGPQMCPTLAELEKDLQIMTRASRHDSDSPWALGCTREWSGLYSSPCYPALGQVHLPQQLDETLIPRSFNSPLADGFPDGATLVLEMPAVIELA